MDFSQLGPLMEATAFAVMMLAFLTMLGVVLLRWPKQLSTPIVQEMKAMGEKFTAALDRNTAALDRFSRH